MNLFKYVHEYKRFDKKESTAGFEPGTLILQNLHLTPRLRGKIQRGGGNYDMNQVLKSANYYEKR